MALNALASGAQNAPRKPRVPFILAALPFVAYPLKLNPRSAAVIFNKTRFRRFVFDSDIPARSGAAKFDTKILNSRAIFQND